MVRMISEMTSSHAVLQCIPLALLDNTGLPGSLNSAAFLVGSLARLGPPPLAGWK